MQNLAHALLLIPLTLSTWTHVELPKKEFPVFVENHLSENSTSWTITTRRQAGGYANFLAEPMAVQSPALRLSWQWSVKTFPNTQARDRFSKRGDDYALRVGLLLDDGKTQISALQKFAKTQIRVSRIIFFDAYPDAIPVHEKSCDQNPYLHEATDCLIRASAELNPVNIPLHESIKKAFHLSDEVTRTFKIVGFWVQADSDDSQSSSEALFSSLRIEGFNP